MTDFLKKTIDKINAPRELGGIASPPPPKGYEYNPNDLLEIPPWLRRTGVKVKVPMATISREIVIPKPPSDRKKRKVKNKLKHLGYPDHMIRGATPEWAAKVIESRHPYKDPLEGWKELDAKIEELDAKIAKKAKP